MTFTVKQTIASCGGKLLKLTHQSQCTRTAMDLNVYLPKQFYRQEGASKKIPTIYYLSGLTCTPQNASEKAFWQPQADKYGFAVVFPDTSPRGDNVPDDPASSWDFGHGAGFYLNATRDPFMENYQMKAYVYEELPKLLSQDVELFQGKVDFLGNIAISGHSMGGMGALNGIFNYYNKYVSCSAFAPVVSPSTVPWGKKAFSGYLQEQKEWAQYDPCELVKNVENSNEKNILIHVGSNDPFMEQLKPALFLENVKGTSWEKHVDLNIVEGFDHSYYFISTFVPEHAKFHAKYLGLLD